MSDYTKPRTDLNSFIPEQNKSSFLKNLNNNLFNRFLTKDEYNHIVGIIGSPDYTSPLKQIIESSLYAQKNQLQPVVYSKLGSETEYLTFPDYLQRLSRLGVDISKFNEWGNMLQFNYAPPIDIDKLINYQDYYWNTSNVNEIPDYITIKNELNWALSRSNQYKFAITQIQTSFDVNIIDPFNLYLTGNQLPFFDLDDFVILHDSSNNYQINQIDSISLDSITGKTEISLVNSMDGITYTTMYNASIPIISTNTDNSFTLSNDLTQIFTPDYIFSAINHSTSINTLFSVVNTTYDPQTNTSTITVDQPIDYAGGWTQISTIPLATLAEAEYNAVNGDREVRYINSWNDAYVGNLIWANEVSLLSSETGYSHLGDHGIYDDSYDFISLGIVAGDTLHINNGPNTGTYRIINVQSNFIAVDSYVRTFTKDNLNYVIAKPQSYASISDDMAPTAPFINEVWINTVNDTVNQWNGYEWVTVVKGILLLTNATQQRYKLSLKQNDPWSASNKWIHKNEIVNFSGKVRAQLPIIEFYPFLELSDTSLATYEWKYRNIPSNLYEEVETEPTLFELIDATLDGTTSPAFIFNTSNSIKFNSKFGNLVADISVGSRLKLSGFANNNGLVTVQSVSYHQPSPTEEFCTYVTLTKNITNPFDLPVGANIGPQYTSQGDLWLGSKKHWMFYGTKNIEASSLQPTPNPMLEIFIQSYVDHVNSVEVNVGLMWQSMSYLTDGNIGTTITFDPSLQQYVLYDDYQEGDIRVYINEIRQYGKFTDNRSLVYPEYVGSITFDSDVIINKSDIIRIELGEYDIEDIGRRSIPLVTSEQTLDPNLSYDLVNIVRIRKMEQDKPLQNLYPFFNLYDVDGTAKDFANEIFKFREDPSYNVNLYLLRRIVNDASTNDYGFTQLLSDSDNKTLYCYKNFAQPNYPLQTIWKRGLHNEQYVPQTLSDGSWDIPNSWIYNINHGLENYINYSELLNHFSTIISQQEVPGLINTATTNLAYLDDNINYGLGGTIKEHNNGLDLSISSVMVNNTNPLQVIQFGHDQYLNGYNFIQEDYIKNIVSLLTTNVTVSNLTSLQKIITSFIENSYTSNSKFDDWFGDSTTYNSTTNIGFKNWVATLPFFGLLKPVVPYILYDSELKLNSVVCHDGHIQEVKLQMSIEQKIFSTLRNVGIPTQIVTSDSTPFSLGSLGSLLIRVNTVTKTRKLYRLNSSSIWEHIDLNNVLANIILDIETQLYKAVPVYDSLIYDLTKNNTNEAYRELNNSQFSLWAMKNDISSQLINNDYVQNDPFTWNYGFTPIPVSPLTGNISYDIAASYQELYTKVFNTPFPHLEPWKLQWYDNKPVWWDSVYVDTTGTRKWKSFMWNNIFNGVVPAGRLLPSGNVSTGINNQIDTVFTYLPINIENTPTSDGYESDALLPPYWNSANTSNSRIKPLYDANVNDVIVNPNIDYTFGDGNINEWEWKTSAQYWYDQMIISFKLDPIRFIYYTFNGNSLININCLNVDPTTKNVYSHKDVLFHGEIDDNGNVYSSNGLNQWYIHNNRYYGYDSDAAQFKSLWKDWDVKLGYLFEAYVDTPSFTITNQLFDMTNKDYQVDVKKTYGYNDFWFDSLYSTVLSAPSTYSKNRSLGIGWTTQFNTSSSINRDITYFPKENFSFRAVKNSNIFEIYAYDLVNAGIVTPTNQAIVSYSESLNLNYSTLYTGSSSYTATITLGITDVSLTLNATNASTIETAITTLNNQLNGEATFFLNDGNLYVQSENDITITDFGLFVTLYSNYTGITNNISTEYAFDKSFDLNGNLTDIFYEGATFTIEDSTQLNGTFTVKSVYYDITNSITKIFVNESLTVTIPTVDGIVRPLSRRTIPDTWTTGTEVYLTSDSVLSVPFDEYTPYYIIVIDDYTFSLTKNYDSAITNVGKITPLTNTISQQYVGRIQSTFTSLGGNVVDTAWRKHYSDTRQAITVPQPLYISNIQSMVDFIDGYSDYMESIGFSTKTKDLDNIEVSSGRMNSWQLEIEYFINWIYLLTVLNQQNDLTYRIKSDYANSRFVYIDDNISSVNTQVNISQQVVLIALDGAILPTPFDNPLKQYIPYYVIPSNDGKGFQLAYTSDDAKKGNYITFDNPGSGNMGFKIYRKLPILPKFMLNPYKKAVAINHPVGVLSDVLKNDRQDVLTNQKIYNQYGTSLTQSQLMVLRNDDNTQIGLTTEINNNNLTSSNPVYITGMHAFVDGYENIITFNDYSVANNLIYDPFLGLKTQRFYVEFNRQPTKTLRPNVGGFILYNNDLMQNFESSINDVRTLYDTYKVLESKPVIQEGRKSLGFTGRHSYMKDININAKSDFIFWRAMIKNKGTNLSIDAYTNQKIFNNADLDEFWVYKLGRFGDSKEKNYIELKMKRSDSTKSVMKVEFVNPDENALDDTYTSVALTDNTRWWDQPDVVDKMNPYLSFYLNARVANILYNQESHIQHLNGNYLLLLDGHYDGVIITYLDNTTGKTKTLTKSTDYVMLNSQIVKFVNDPTNLTNLTVSELTYNYNAHTPAVFVDKTEGRIVNQIAIWNPALNQHNQYAYSLMDIIDNVDPAVYTNDFINSADVNIWYKSRLNTVWMDTSKLAYIPYYDQYIFPSSNDRINNWGKLADYAQLNVNQWIESTVLPANYTQVYPNGGTPRQLLYKNVGTIDNPLWNPIEDEIFNILAALITTSTTVPFSGVVNMYRNGIFDLSMDLTQHTLNDYMYGALIPDQISKPLLSDNITVILPVYSPTAADISNLLYKYDTPYSVMSKVSETNGSLVPYYYFWVQNNTSIITNTTNYASSSLQAKKDLLNNPNPYMILSGLRYNDDGYGIIFGDIFDGVPYDLPVRYTQVAIKGLKGQVMDDNRYALRFIRDFTLRDKMPINGNIYDYSSVNPVKTPLALKNVHYEWKMFRKNQTDKIDIFLWEKLISALVGYPVVNNIIDTSKTIPSLDRILFDSLYDTDTQYGLGDEQIFVSPDLGLTTIQTILNDPNQNFINIDITSFLNTYNFSTVNNIIDAMYAIYESFNVVNVNYIYFATLNDAMTLRYNSPDFFKTSWVAIDIAQNVDTVSNYTPSIATVFPGGACDINENIIIPTQLPLPTPSPTPSITPTISVTISITPSVFPTHTPSYTPTMTVTPTMTMTTSPTPTTTATPTVTATITPTMTVTPTVTVTASPSPTVTATSTVTATITPTVTITPTMSPTITTTPTITATATPTITVTPSVTGSLGASTTPTPTPSVTASPTMTATPTITVTPTMTATITITPEATPTPTMTNTITPSITMSPTVTPTYTPTSTPPVTVTPEVTVTPTMTSTTTPPVTVTPTNTATVTPTITPTTTVTPTFTPTTTPAI